jgi:peptidyl-prolyl cis-trans isomerase A (cyclophilin A)
MTRRASSLFHAAVHHATASLSLATARRRGRVPVRPLHARICAIAALVTAGSASISRQAAAQVTAQGGVQVAIETTIGAIGVVVDTIHAPITGRNFLRYVDGHFYDGGSFFRTVRADNQATDPVRIAVVQAAADSVRQRAPYAPIPLERTTVSGLHHVDGTLSMARNTPESATSSFFVCVGDQPSLDFGGARNPDGQGFAAFGHVVTGMAIVRAIWMSQADGQRLAPPIAIKRAYRVAHQ